LKKRYIRFPDISVPSFIPRLPHISPTSPITIAVTGTMALTAIVTGILFSAFVGQDIPPTLPEPATYTAGNPVGVPNVQQTPGVANNTLKLLTAGAPMDNITFTNMDFDPPSGNGITVNASSTQTGILTCSQIIFRNVRAPSLTMTTGISAFDLTGTASTTEADGATITISASTTAADVAPSSTRGTANFVVGSASTGQVNPDRIIVDVEDTSTTCNLLLFEDISTTGPIEIQRIHGGEISFEGLNQIGDDGNIDTKEFLLTASVNQVGGFGWTEKVIIGSR
jgi:hypothetical protein